MKIIKQPPKDWNDLYPPLKLMKEAGDLKVLNPQKNLNEYNFPFTTNPYTGCNYGCIYCYSTQSEGWKEFWDSNNINYLHPKPKWDYVNRLKLDLNELSSISNEYKEIQVGNTFDTYPSIEQNNRLTRNCFKLFQQYPDWKVHIETKSDLILNDIDILRTLSSRDKFIEVEITITTQKHEDIFEPRAPPTQRRFEVIKELADNGIYVRVMLMPILEGYTDVEKIKETAYKCGAKDIKEDILHDDRYPDLSLYNLITKHQIPTAK